MSAALIEKTVENWLRPKSANTQRGYRRDVELWLGYCEQADVDPLSALRVDAEKFRTYLEEGGLADASVARHMRGVSSFYDYAVEDGVAARNPFSKAPKPKIDPNFSPTVWLSQDEAARFLRAAERRVRNERPGRPSYVTAMRNLAMVSVTLVLGLRTEEVATLTVGDYSVVAEVRGLSVRGKGGKQVRRTVPPQLAECIDRYLAERGPVRDDEPLFATETGRPVDYKTRYEMVGVIARDARLSNALSITPHSLRHTYATLATQQGASTRDLQRSMAHSSARTTERYRHDEMDDPSVLVAGALLR